MTRADAVREAAFKKSLDECIGVHDLLELLFDTLLKNEDVELTARGIEQALAPHYETDREAVQGRGLLSKVTRLLEAEAPSEEPTPVILPEAVWEKLKALALQALPRLGPRTVSGVLLGALDATMQSKLWTLFEARESQQPMKPGDFFPIGARNLKPFFVPEGMESAPPEKPSFSPWPARQDDSEDRKLTYLGVLPKLSRDYKVTFNFRAGAALSRFVKKPVVGVLQPNAQLDPEFEVSCAQKDGVFFGVRPTDPAQQEKRILELLHQAEAEHVTLALLPELSVTRELSRKLGTWLTGAQRRLSLMVAGSFHHTEGRRQFNRSQTFAPCLAAPLEHDKFNPFQLGKWKKKTFKPELKEHLVDDEGGQLSAAPVRITIHWSRSWSFTTLICKDFLAPDARYLLERLRPNFAFIVALSPGTSLFKSYASTLAGAAQTSTFIANFAGSPKEDGQTAVAALPIVKSDDMLTYATTSQTVPGLLVFNAHQWKQGWQPPRRPMQQTSKREV